MSIPWIKAAQVSHNGLVFTFLDITLDQELFKLPCIFLKHSNSFVGGCGVSSSYLGNKEGEIGP